MKGKKISITTRAMLTIFALLLASSAILGTLLVNRSRALMKTLINERMLDIANTAAAMLDGDVLQSLTVWDTGMPGYRAIYDALRLFQDNIDLEFIYTVREIGDGAFIFLIDPAEENASPFGELVEVTDALRVASLGTPAVDETPYVDAYGRFYSAYSPVFDSEDRVAGIVAVDFRADWYEEQLSKYTNTVLLYGLVYLAVGTLTVYFVINRLRRHFQAMNTGYAAPDDTAEPIEDVGVG